MHSRRLSRIAALAALPVLLATQLATPVAAGAAPPTAVHVFVPAVPKGKPIAGNCWTTSIATNRHGAYRCMAGNAISDPCFTTSTPDIVVCDPNPVAGKPGFAMHLHGSLPASPPVRGVVMPWLVELYDGIVCMPLTGTRDLVGKTVVGYGCTPAKGQSSSTYAGLGDMLDSSGPTWHARRLTYRSGPNGPVLVSSATVPLRAVWR